MCRVDVVEEVGQAVTMTQGDGKLKPVEDPTVPTSTGRPVLSCCCLGVLLRICEFSKAIQLFGNLTAEAAVDWWPETTQYLGPICWGSLADVLTLLRRWLWQLVAHWVSGTVPVQGTGGGRTCHRCSVRQALGDVP